MLVPLKASLSEEPIRELLSYSLLEDVDQPDRAIREYRNDDRLQVMGLVSEDEVVALIGYRVTDERTLDIRHIAVTPEERGMGFGRGIILELIEREKPKSVVAETDADAVDFYRNIGFTVHSIGEKYPGTERFRCTFITDFEDADLS